MTPGTLLFHEDFVFSDGTTGKKILSILNDGSAGYYVAAKTTSRQSTRRRSPGCNADDRLPNFFFPQGSCFLHEDTWIGLDEFFELDREELLQRHFEGRIRTLGVLEKDQAIDLLECACSCQDITQSQARILEGEIESLRAMDRDPDAE